MAALGAGLAAAAGAAGEWRVAVGADYVLTQDVPSIGNFGSFVNRRINPVSPTIRVARMIARNWALELGYRYTPTYAARMVAGSSMIFLPEPGEPMVYLPTLTPYELSQRTHTVSFGPAWSFVVARRWRATVGAFAAYEAVGSRIDFLSETTVFDLVTSTGAVLVPRPPSAPGGRTFEVAQRGETSYRHSVRCGARLGLEYELGRGWSVEATGTLIDSAGAAGAYVGLGVVGRL